MNWKEPEDRTTQERDCGLQKDRFPVYTEGQWRLSLSQEVGIGALETCLSLPSCSLSLALRFRVPGRQRMATGSDSPEFPVSYLFCAWEEPSQVMKLVAIGVCTLPDHTAGGYLGLCPLPVCVGMSSGCVCDIEVWVCPFLSHALADRATASGWRDCVYHWGPVVSQEVAQQRESPSSDFKG